MGSDPTADEELRRSQEAAYDEAGVDVTQIDLMLSLTPRERLEHLYEAASSLARLMKHADTD
jgi:hypothetical protein